MIAYKCDICKEYCNDVMTLNGISQPETYKKYSHVQDEKFECCKKCYDAIMSYIQYIMC